MEMNTEINMKVTIMEAEDVEDVRKFFRMKPYAEVSITGDPNSKQKTKADKHGKTNPEWYELLNFPLSESAVLQHGLFLKIELHCERKLGDRYIGVVHESIKDLYERASANGGSVVLTCPVKRGCAESQGKLRFSCSFGDRRTSDEKRSPNGRASGIGDKVFPSGLLIISAAGQIANLFAN